VKCLEFFEKGECHETTYLNNSSAAREYFFVDEYGGEYGDGCAVAILRWYTHQKIPS
jgi:hypothetical protein